MLVETGGKLNPWSRPMRARGLKPHEWCVYIFHAESRPMRARGLKPKRGDSHRDDLKRRAPCGRVD